MALICRKGLNHFGLGILVPILIVTNLTEILGVNCKHFFNTSSNEFIYNISYLLLTPMYLYLFASMLGGNSCERRRLRWIALAIETFLISNFCFVQGWNHFNTFSALLVAMTFIILSCLVLTRLTIRKDDETSLVHDPTFWINSFILLINLVFLLILGTYKFTVTNSLNISTQNLYLAIMPAANVVFYTGYGSSFLLCQMQRNK